MGIETEHKYLVRNTDYKHLATSYKNIRQGYLSKDPMRTVRIRIADSTGYITIKGKNSGDTRQEFEYKIPLDDAEYLLTMCEPGIINKTRYIVPFAGNIWEVDEFHAHLEGLCLAEIELGISTHDYPLPPFVGKEVSGNPDY